VPTQQMSIIQFQTMDTIQPSPSQKQINKNNGDTLDSIRSAKKTKMPEQNKKSAAMENEAGLMEN